MGPPPESMPVSRANFPSKVATAAVQGAVGRFTTQVLGASTVVGQLSACTSVHEVVSCAGSVAQVSVAGAKPSARPRVNQNTVQ